MKSALVEEESRLSTVPDSEPENLSGMIDEDITADGEAAALRTHHQHQPDQVEEVFDDDDLDGGADENGDDDDE